MLKKVSLLWFLFAGFLIALQISACSLQLSQDQTSSVSPVGNSRVTVDNVGRLTGVNWFGFETGNLSPHGLWSRDYKSMLKQIKDLGFNCIRLPWCNSVLSGTPNSIQINADGVDAYTGQKGLNLDLAGLSSIQVMDKIIDEATRVQGLKIILDNHSLKPDGYMNETLWYTTDIPESKWISDWVTIVNRYKNNPYVVGVDLKNEPHGNMGTGMKPPATWGYNEPGQGITDWKAAAERCASSILQANPNILIIVEGVEAYSNASGTDYYWWGGNLKGVADYPITSIPKSQLMYSFHEYGPEVYNQSWFSDPNFPNNMPAIWDTHFWFIYKQNIAPLFLGEFGIKESSAADASSVAGTWFRTLMSYVGSKCNWTFWSMNPNSGDTGGILKDDWVSVNTAKYGVLKGYLAAQFAPLGASSSAVSSSVSSSRSSAVSSVSSSRSSAISSVSSSRSSAVSSVSSSSSSAVSSVASSVSSVQYTEISIPFTKDGAGEFYWKTKGFSTTQNDYSHYVNSWNLNILEINGTSYANKWVPTFQIPAASDGYWYIHYKGSYSWCHLEIK